MRYIYTTPFHLLIERLLGAAGWALECSLASLQSCLLDTVAVKSTTTAGGDQPSWPRTRRGEGIVQTYLNMGVCEC